MPQWPRRQRFWKDIPPRAMFNLLLAVGLTFSCTGFLGDIVALDRQPFSSALYRGVIDGVTAAAVLAAIARDARWVLLAGLMQIAGGVFLARVAPYPPWAAFTGLTSHQRLQIDSVAGLVVIISGYNAFLVFIGGEGRRQVAVRTELDLAQRIHETLVPAVTASVAGATVHGVSRPSGQVGGDLVDLIRI